MATMLQVKLGVVILVVAAVAGTGSGASFAVAGAGPGLPVAARDELCSFRIRVYTPFGWGAGTDATVTLGAYGKNGAGWTLTHDGHGRAFDQDSLVEFSNNGKPCMEPCHLTLKINGAGNTWGSPWYPKYVQIDVVDAAVRQVAGSAPFLKYYQYFKVERWVYDGYPIELRQGKCNKSS